MVARSCSYHGATCGEIVGDSDVVECLLVVAIHHGEVVATAETDVGFRVGKPPLELLADGVPSMA